MRICSFFLFYFLVLVGQATTNDHGVISFSQNDYPGARQNWSVSTAGNGIIYFANHSGLLEFDGTNWKLNSQPNLTTMRCVKVMSDSVVYTGGYMELGYWVKGLNGDYSYHSLNQKASKFFRDNTEFWDIAIKNDSVYFRSYEQILAFHNDSVFRINPDGAYPTMSTVNDKVLVAVQDRGIFEVKGNRIEPYIVDNTFVGKQIKFIIPFKNNQILVGTESNGILIWNGEELKMWNEEWTDYFIKNELNRAYYTNDHKVIIGSLIDGIAVFDEDGRFLQKINTENGLQNNTILGIATDEWHNIWLALDVGIGFISGNQNHSFAIYQLPGTGAIYATAIFDDKLYLGTNQGLFEKSLDLDDPKIRLVPETQDQIWGLKVIYDQLLVGHNQGTFVIDNGKSKQISFESGGFNFVEDPLHPELILQSTYNRLVVFKKSANGIEFRNTVEGFSNLIRFIEFDHLGNLWASHMHKGVYKIKMDDERRKVLPNNIQYYGSEIFGKENHIYVFKVENRIVFSTGDKMFTYDDLKDTIVEYSNFNNSLGKYKKSHRIIDASNHYYWFIGKEFVGLFFIDQENTTLIKEFPTSLFINPTLVDGYENLLPLNEYSAILCLQNGVAYLDAATKDTTVDLVKEYTPILRHIEFRNNKDERQVLPLSASQLKTKHAFNNLQLQFSFPMLSDLPVYYQYMLEGLNSEWSAKSRNPQFNLVRLPYGKYKLKVKAVDLWGNESQVYSLSFEVLRPLSASRWAVLFYTILLVSALLLFRMWGIRQTRKREKYQHDLREQELTRLRNDKLRSEVSHKSKELANSTMAIIKKNEFLLDLKKIIQKQKTELGSRYPDKYFNYLNKKIDDNISNQDDWKVFENNFERAHEQFFKKMKDKYPDLTPSDLQLSAYLRMNLSSKEIAPLLGISVRGVENHRYRLRKKMNIAHDDSLTNAILEL